MNTLKHYYSLYNITNEVSNSPLAYYLHRHKYMESDRGYLSRHDHSRKTPLTSLDPLDGESGGFFF